MGITYEAIGQPSIKVSCSTYGATILADGDGFASLARLFSELGKLERDDHIHLTPSMQLDAGSEPPTLAIPAGPWQT